MLELFQSFNFEVFALCGLIVFIAAIMQMSIGMGFGMLASPLIALVKPEIVPAAIMILGLVVAFSGAWRERAQISIAELKLGVSGRVFGSATAFVLLLFLGDLDAFLLIFGLMMLFAIGLSLSRWKITFSHKSLFVLSIISGLMGTITAVGAPPMALIYHDRSPSIVRPTLNAFFGAGSVLGLISLSSSGWLSLEDIVWALMLFPVMIFGIWVSPYFRSFAGRWLSGILLTLSTIASIMLVFRGIGLL